MAVQDDEVAPQTDCRTAANVNAEVEIRRAEGQRDARVKDAEGLRDAAIREAEGQREAQIQIAEGQAEVPCLIEGPPFVLDLSTTPFPSPILSTPSSSLFYVVLSFVHFAIVIFLQVFFLFCP
jgi:hypothetical protein